MAKSTAKQVSLASLALDKPKEGESREFEDRGTTGTCSGKARREITSLEELVAFFRIDLSVWEVERWVANQWQVGTSDGEGNLKVTPLYQVKAWLKKRTAAIAARSEIAEAIEAGKRVMARGAWKIATKKPRKEPGSLLCMGIMDPHFGKMCWARETGWENYDVDIARKCVSDAVADLLAQATAMPYPIDKILLPLGNDFFHVDNGKHETTGGTPQDVDGRWQKSYRAGREAAMEMIRTLVDIAPVHVSIVPGNHDEETMFCLGDALEMVFESAKHVAVDNSPKLTKYFEWHSGLIGMNHGKDIKPARLSGVMAAECREAWGRTTWREWFIGHWHSKGEAMFAPVSEEQGVRIRTIPSLTPPDAWHARKGYVGNVRAAECLVYHSRLGYRAQFSHVPEGAK